MNLLLLGPVGSGKGTLAGIISKKYNIPHISTGEIFRRNIQEKTELGCQIQKYVEKGELVPEIVTNKIVIDRLSKQDCNNGFILDGFPRNLSQAKAIDKIINFDKVVYIDISEDEIIKRLSSRRMCKVCKQPTSINWLINDRCEKCGGEVYIRDDDKPEVIKVRLKTNKISNNLLEFYKKKGIFYQIDASGSVSQNYDKINRILKEEEYDKN